MIELIIVIIFGLPDYFFLLSNNYVREIEEQSD
jgi:hypothetical protein